MTRARTLAVVNTQPLTIHLLSEDIGEEVRLGKKRFVDVGLGDWAGFYDWLRSSSGDLFGVRTWLDTSAVAVVKDLLAPNPAIELGDPGDLCVYLGAMRDHDAARSGDQELGTHRVMRSDDGYLALTYDLRLLEETELARLEELAKAGRLG